MLCHIVDDPAVSVRPVVHLMSLSPCCAPSCGTRHELDRTASLACAVRLSYMCATEHSQCLVSFSFTRRNRRLVHRFKIPPVSCCRGTSVHPAAERGAVRDATAPPGRYALDCEKEGRPHVRGAAGLHRRAQDSLGPRQQHHRWPVRQR